MPFPDGSENTVLTNKVLQQWIHNRECFMNYLGIWMIEPSWLKSAIASIQNGTLKPIEMGRHRKEDRNESIYSVIDGGVAVIEINGVMMKGESKFGGVSTLFTRHAIREAVIDPDVHSILLHIDSPGGHVAGTNELADTVFKSNQEKTIFAHIDDLGASAAFWVASQTSRITANVTAEVGSIGTVAIAEDTSEQFKKEGIKVHVISTGEFKGSFAEGTEITKEMLDELRDRVEDLNRHFLEAVSRGRNLNQEQMKKVTDGRIFIAEKALKLGLIDGIQSLDTTISQISSQNDRNNSDKDFRMRKAEALIKLSE